MGGRSRLSADRPRTASREDGDGGRVRRRVWAVLVAEYGAGALSAPMARELAAAVLIAATNADASFRALEEARRAQATGRGRRPSEQQLERRRKRHGPDADALASAHASLRALVARTSQGRDLASRLARVAQR